jgi:putative ABC transport system permease protein
MSIGLVAALGFTRLMSSLLFGVTAADPATYAATSALLATSAALASYLSARGVTAVSPLEALRAE